MRWRNGILVAIGALLIVFAPKLDALAVTSDSDALTFLLLQQKTVLYVTDVMPTSNPLIGGLIATPTEAVNHADFEAKCAEYVQRFPAILVDGTSDCLTARKTEATTFVRDSTFELGGGGFTLFIR